IAATETPLTRSTASAAARNLNAFVTGLDFFSRPCRARVLSFDREERGRNWSLTLFPSCFSGGTSQSGGRGIRTHETFLPTIFQDWLHRPLGQPSRFANEQGPILADGRLPRMTVLPANRLDEGLERPEHEGEPVVDHRRRDLAGRSDHVIGGLAHGHPPPRDGCPEQQVDVVASVADRHHAAARNSDFLAHALHRR